MLLLICFLSGLVAGGQTAKPVSLRDLKPYGLVGTPTAVLVNDEGIVTNLWSGSLTELQQSEVLRALQIRVESAALKIGTWMLIQYFVPALFCLALNWVYFLRTSLHPSALVSLEDQPIL